MAARPVVKWAGGKARLFEALRAWMPESIETYAEPFCGGAAVFFALAAEPKRRFRRAVLADKNPELIALYRSLQTDVDALVERLGAYQEEHLTRDPEARREHYYEVRGVDVAGMTALERAARLVFLNKTCFNGLFRVNASGQFNVPFGRYARPKILDEKVLRDAHEALQGVTVHLGDFAAVTAELERGDFVYFDPPYVPLSRTANFTRYGADPFDRSEQERLAEELSRLRARGVKAMLSNAKSPVTNQLYARFVCKRVSARRSINSDPNKRGDVNELIVMNYGGREPRAAKRRAS